MAKQPEILGPSRWRVFAVYPNGQQKKQPNLQVIPKPIAQNFGIKDGSEVNIRIKNEDSDISKTFVTNVFSGTEFEIPKDIFPNGKSFLCEMAFDLLALGTDDDNGSPTEIEAVRKIRISLDLKKIHILNGTTECALTGDRVTESLEAAHIFPWSMANNNQRSNIENTLLLSATAHRLYDAGLIIISDAGFVNCIFDINKSSLKSVKDRINNISAQKRKFIRLRNTEYKKVTLK